MPFPVLSSLPSRISQSGHLAVEEERHVNRSLCVRPYSNEEELQQEDWRSRYIQLLSRSQKWEKTIQLKDSTLQYLQQALQDRDIALKRQEKLIQETKQRLHFQGKSEKAQLEKKELEVSLLRAKALQQAEKLAGQAKLIGVLNHRQEEREQELAAYSINVKWKVEKLKVQLQRVEASLQSREEELETYKKCCNDLKTIIWKKDRMLEKSKHLEEQLQSTLKRKHLEYETLEVANDKLRGQNSQMTKNITEMKRNSEACEAALQQDLKMQAFCLQKQKDQIRRLELILRQEESCLEAKSRELEASYNETERLAEEYGRLKKNYESLTCKHAQLHIMLRDLEQKLNVSQSREEAGSLHIDFLEEDSFPAQCRGVNQDGFNLAYKHGKAGPSTDAEALVRTRTSMPCHNGISTPAPSEYCSKYGVSHVGSGARPGLRRYFSSFEEDMHDEQLCSSDQLQIKTELSADQFKPENVDSLKAPCSFAEIPPTSFPKPAGAARNKWRLSDQVFILAEDTSCMERKAELKSTKKAVQSSTSPELQKIQEEIEERERRWKQIEASMRAELSRRKVQLHEANIL